MPVDPDLTVDEIMRRWPASIRVFISRHMLCPGCPIAAFHSVADACREHHVALDAFLGELEAAIRPAPSPWAVRQAVEAGAAP